MNEHECNPATHPTWTELKDHCEYHHDSMRDWAKAKIEDSLNDRTETKRRVSILEMFKEKVMWGIVAGSILIFASIWAAPYITRNGEGKTIRELSEKVNIIVDKQAKLDTIINDIRADQLRREAKEKK